MALTEKIEHLMIRIGTQRNDNYFNIQSIIALGLNIDNWSLLNRRVKLTIEEKRWKW